MSNSFYLTAVENKLQLYIRTEFSHIAHKRADYFITMMDLLGKGCVAFSPVTRCSALKINLVSRYFIHLWIYQTGLEYQTSVTICCIMNHLWIYQTGLEYQSSVTICHANGMYSIWESFFEIFKIVLVLWMYYHCVFKGGWPWHTWLTDIYYSTYND